MIIKKYILVIILILSFFLASDRKEHLMNFSFYNFDSSDIKLQNSAGIAKPMLSSLIIPGLGQYQTGNKKKAALFFGIEVLAQYLNNIYNKEADKKVSEYQDFSEDHWSFEDWIINYDCWNPAYQGINNDCDYSFSNLFSNIEIDDNGNQVEDYLSIWEHSHHINFYYDNNLISTNDEAFQDLYFEFTTWNPDAHQGQSFMEFYNIEVDKDHHFYEGIRKYNMFFAGWDDATTDIQQVVQASGYSTATSPNKNMYNKTWNDSIELYDYAEYAMTAIYLNHVISMFDIYFKSKFDNRLNIDIESRYMPNTYSGNYLLRINLEL